MLLITLACPFPIHTWSILASYCAGCLQVWVEHGQQPIPTAPFSAGKHGKSGLSRQSAHPGKSRPTPGRPLRVPLGNTFSGLRIFPSVQCSVALPHSWPWTGHPGKVFPSASLSGRLGFAPRCRTGRKGAPYRRGKPGRFPCGSPQGILRRLPAHRPPRS